MTPLRIEKAKYSICFDKNTGRVIELINKTAPSDVNWAARGDRFALALPFVHGTQEKEELVDCPVIESSGRDARIVCRSRSGLTEVTHSFAEDAWRIRARIPPDRGPRSGLELDFSLLDCGDPNPWETQLLPTSPYADPELRHGYMILTEAQGQFLVLAFTRPFAAWRLKYSYEGHRIHGLQLLSRCDDLLPGKHERPEPVEELTVEVRFADSLRRAYEAVSHALDLPLAIYPVSGGCVGSTVSVELLGNPERIEVITPRGENRALVMKAERASIFLETPGLHRIRCYRDDGRFLESSLVAIDGWKPLIGKVNNFYRKYFQLPEGAFARAIDSRTLTSRGGRTLSGEAFGEIYEPSSCRSGEFGGFAGWAMMKNLLAFGQDPVLMEAVRRYVEDWLCQGGSTPEKRYNGALALEPQVVDGIRYGEYHPFGDCNFPQHEVFFIEQLMDYHLLTKKPEVLNLAAKVGRHLVDEHQGEDGAILNDSGGKRLDYSSVHVPGIALIKLGNMLRYAGREEADFFLAAAARVLDHLVRRGYRFHTEGESCTEDGSFACTALTLLYAYRFLSPKEEYRSLGTEMLARHDAFTMWVPDARIFRSSFRFWETQYESADWGPSLNAGHGWTLWTSEAKFHLYHIDGNIQNLLDSYSGFLANLARIDEQGGMPVCFTPDMIPGTPHGSGFGVDYRKTSIVRAQGYTPYTYSASGNYAFIRAEETWFALSAVLFGKSGEAALPLNGRFDRKGVFVSAAPRFDFLALDRVPDAPFSFAAARPTTIRAPKITAGSVRTGVVISSGGDWLSVEPRDERIQLGPV